MLGILISLSALADDLIKEKTRQAIEIKYMHDCDTLVDDIRKDTRLRMTDGLSIEQINNRSTIEISKKHVDCLGHALLSNSRGMRISYGVKIDKNNEWIIYYKKY